MVLNNKEARLFIHNQCRAFPSLRAAAKHFDIDVGYLSRIINNKKPLYGHIAERFGLKAETIFHTK